MSNYIDDVFGPQGALAAKFPGYSPREGQVALTRAVDAAITSGTHLIAEAPTGTGKSLAYAVPAIYHAAHSGKRAVIVTANIALQEQIVRKDLPLLAEILPWKFTYALLKGWSNYLCKQRLNEGAPGQLDPRDREINDQIAEWARSTKTGDMSELTFEPPQRVWSRFSIASDDCAGKECEYLSRCHPERARVKANEANVIVTNYHLFFADMQVRQATQGYARLLPAYDTVIFDEAHKASDTARDFFGFRITEGSIARAGSLLPGLQERALVSVAENFFKGLLNYRRSGKYKARIREQNIVSTLALDGELEKAEITYLSILRTLPDYEERDAEERKRGKKLERRCVRVMQIRQQIASAMRLYSLPDAPWKKHPDVAQGDTAETRWYWSDPTVGGDNEVRSERQLAVYEDVFFIEEQEGRASLGAKPISVASMLNKRLFGVTKSVTLTSATIVTKNSFDFIIEDIGAPREKTKTLIAASPFSWKEQALLILPQDVPEPNDSRFPIIAAEKCAEVIEFAQGRTLALFTSYKNLNAAHERVSRMGYRVLRQGDMPRMRLIDEFRRDVRSVLMGVESFWAGVDVPGESLSCVFIDKLPFTPPDDPVMDALTEREPKDWFMKYSVPRAIIAFKQGFGRLIRTTTDRGVVVVLDKRISTKFYGKFFLAGLPPVQHSANIGDVKRFLAREPLIISPAPVSQRAPGSSLFDVA